MSRIVELTSENVKRLTAVHIKPDGKLVEAKAALERAQQEHEGAKGRANASNFIDTAPVEAKLASATAINQAVERKNQKAQMEAELTALRERSQSLSDDITDLDAEKTEAMSNAKWPVEGLGFSDEGVTLNDLPFEQASSAEKLRVSVAMGLAMNPGLRVLLIRDGSLLDENSMELLAALADEQGAQLWIERVGRDQHSSVIIEDGAVLQEQEAEAATV